MRCYSIVKNKYESRALQLRLFRKGYCWRDVRTMEMKTEKSKELEEIEIDFPYAIYFGETAREDPFLTYSDLWNIKLHGNLYKRIKLNIIEEIEV